MRCFLFYAAIVFVALSCSTGGASKLEKALSGAMKEKKVTQQKMESIIVEYNKLQEEDQVTAREYADQVLTAIEMGGDSSHIDAARRQVLKKKDSKPEIEV